MRRPDAKSWWLLAAIGGIIYPALVYYYFDKAPPAFFCLIALGLIGARIIVTGRRAEGHFWLPVLLVAGATMTMVLFIDARLAVKIYPILMSLSVASVFALSLRYPPTVIERLARIREPDLSSAGITYTRKVTIVWVVFLIANAGVSLITALWGTLAQWTLWNGLLSYLAMGTLFAGEWIVRRWVRA
jgi:uncharacterized membrane protein